MKIRNLGDPIQWPAIFIFFVQWLATGTRCTDTGMMVLRDKSHNYKQTISACPVFWKCF
jgi:hypothetical protein